MGKKLHFLLFVFFIGYQVGFSQDLRENLKELNIKLRVLDKKTEEPIKDAEVKVNGRLFNYHQVTDNYVIRAKIGDELVVSHKDFETVYYNIKNDEEIKIFVEGQVEPELSVAIPKENLNPQEKRGVFSKTRYKNNIDPNLYFQYLDSAKYYKTRDIDKSLSFIEKILLESKSSKRDAASYKVLGDIYLYWKQYDLAIANYKTSISLFPDVSTEIKLARTNYLFKDFKESKRVYIELLLSIDKLNEKDKVIIYEGLGDANIGLKEYAQAKDNYQKALFIAEENDFRSEVTDLNSRIAEVYGLEGKLNEASQYFKNSLELAKKEGVARLLSEQEKVANFFNYNGFYEDEIALRKKGLEELKKVEDSVKVKGWIESNIGSILLEGLRSIYDIGNGLTIPKSQITVQSINYKIGRAYVQKEQYRASIPYLKKSIEEAKKRNDIVVQKDATRKLSEVYENLNRYVDATKAYEDYVNLIDTIYVRKQQEIAQIQRFNKKISENQNRISSLEKNRELIDSKINLANKEKQLAEEINKRQLNLIYTLIAGILLLILLAYLQVRNNKQQKLANNLLALKSMRTQMNPHFIFNALNSVNSFIAENDERNANRYLSEFSTLMRTVLENSDEDFIPISKEIELLELYVKLEHNRFRDKFDYDILIDSNIQVTNFSIPPMLLQPYIENAIWHGLRYKKEKGNLTISMEQIDEETILISIEDDGIGRENSRKMKTGNQLKRKSKGMINIKNRIDILNNMYEDRISVKVSDMFENGEGTKVELLLKRE